MVRIVKQPTGYIDGISLKNYHVGQTYDVVPILGDYLVLQGYAVSEMRVHVRSERKRSNERRQGRPGR